MANLAAPQSPPTSKRRIESPPPAPGRRRVPRKSGQVLLEVVEIRMLSGTLLAQIRSNEPSLPDEFWYTAQLRLQIANMLGIEACRLKLANVKGHEISDEECIAEGPLTAIVSQPNPFEEVVSG